MHILVINPNSSASMTEGMLKAIQGLDLPDVSLHPLPSQPSILTHLAVYQDPDLHGPGRQPRQH